MGESAYVEKSANLERKMHIWARMGSAGKREVEDRQWTRAHILTKKKMDIWTNLKNSVERFARAKRWVGFFVIYVNISIHIYI